MLMQGTAFSHHQILEENLSEFLEYLGDLLDQGILPESRAVLYQCFEHKAFRTALWIDLSAAKDLPECLCHFECLWLLERVDHKMQ